MFLKNIKDSLNIKYSRCNIKHQFPFYIRAPKLTDTLSSFSWLFIEILFIYKSLHINDKWVNSNCHQKNEFIYMYGCFESNPESQKSWMSKFGNYSAAKHFLWSVCHIEETIVVFLPAVNLCNGGWHTGNTLVIEDEVERLTGIQRHTVSVSERKLTTSTCGNKK